jgi:hypothetical protein
MASTLTRRQVKSELDVGVKVISFRETNSPRDRTETFAFRNPILVCEEYSRHAFPAVHLVFAPLTCRLACPHRERVTTPRKWCVIEKRSVIVPEDIPEFRCTGWEQWTRFNIASWIDNEIRKASVAAMYAFQMSAHDR